MSLAQKFQTSSHTCAEGSLHPRPPAAHWQMANMCVYGRINGVWWSHRVVTNQCLRQRSDARFNSQFHLLRLQWGSALKQTKTQRQEPSLPPVHRFKRSSRLLLAIRANKLFAQDDYRWSLEFHVTPRWTHARLPLGLSHHVSKCNFIQCRLRVFSGKRQELKRVCGLFFKIRTYSSQPSTRIGNNIVTTVEFQVYY